jgi:copper chaperone
MSSTMEKVTLTAPDISCEHCTAAINKEVGALAGVNEVNAEEQTKQVHVSYDPAKVTLAQIEATMAEEGYPVQK